MTDRREGTNQKTIKRSELIAMARERDEELPEPEKVRACGKARHQTSGTNEEAEGGSKKAEKGTPGRSHQPGRNNNGISEH